jgi:hypothetical protein
VKFIHRFSRSVTCAVEIADELPERGVSHIRNVVWSGNPKKRHLAEYIFWMHALNAHLSDLWQEKIMYVVQRSPRNWEFWDYEPGKPPKRLDKEELEALARSEDCN